MKFNKRNIKNTGCPCLQYLYISACEKKAYVGASLCRCVCAFVHVYTNFLAVVAYMEEVKQAKICKC